MAEVKGYTCDGPACATFAASPSGVPSGWMTVELALEVPRAASFANGEPGTERKRSTRHICSPKCLVRLGRVLNGEDLSPRKRPETTGKISNSALGQHKKNHSLGKHADDPKPGCPECEAATA